MRDDELDAGAEAWSRQHHQMLKFRSDIAGCRKKQVLRICSLAKRMWNGKLDITCTVHHVPDRLLVVLDGLDQNSRSIPEHRYRLSTTRQINNSHIQCFHSSSMQCMTPNSIVQARFLSITRTFLLQTIHQPLSASLGLPLLVSALSASLS